MSQMKRFDFLIRSASVNLGKPIRVSEKELEDLSRFIEYTILEVR